MAGGWVRDALSSLGLAEELDPLVLAIGWATVELDRAARELGPSLGVTFTDVRGSEHLGCACRRSASAIDGVDVLLLEPTTEGRLAATLARHGEGWAAVWLPDHVVMAPADPVRSASRPGPLGPERLVLGGTVSGPHRLLVEAGTIDES